MKKTLLLAGVLLSMGVASAQTGLGVKGGVNLSTFNGTGDDDNVKTKVGAYVGVSYEYKFSDNLAVQPEVVYSMQGAKAKDAKDTEAKLGYINVPVMVKYYPINQFFVAAGPQVGFNVSAKSKDGGVEYDLKDDIKKVEFGLGVGLGYEFYKNIGIEARYNFGLSKILKEENIKTKNEVAQIGLFYKF